MPTNETFHESLKRHIAADHQWLEELGRIKQQLEAGQAPVRLIGHASSLIAEIEARITADEAWLARLASEPEDQG